MTRAQQTITAFVVLATLYLSAFLGFVPLPAKIQDDVVPVLPFWAIVSFGAYLLAKLGYGVFSFNDVPEAHEELVKEIEQARADLKKRGVSVD
ncbi:dolichol-phosphate mannosyltransferase subunit 3 [Venturia nashicola]|nr:dolichol-phosphate mannosyltransferase subunit 3 [Venturia nashicola]